MAAPISVGQASETVSEFQESSKSWHDRYVRAVMNYRTADMPALRDGHKAAVGAGFIPARCSRIDATGGDKPRPYRTSCYYFGR